MHIKMPHFLYENNKLQKACNTFYLIFMPVIHSKGFKLISINNYFFPYSLAHRVLP